MKKICTLLMVALFAINSFAAFTPVNPGLKATEVLIPIGKTGQTISLYHLAHVSVNDFEKVSGKHLKFTDRIGFKLAQRELRKGIAEDGTIQSKKMKKSLARVTGGEYGFHAGGFVLGFFLGLIGVIIAYVISDDYKRNRVKWAWIGWGIFLVAYIALLIAIL